MAKDRAARDTAAKGLAAKDFGDGIKTSRSQWSFAGGVAKSFDRHVERSIPLYHEGHRLVCGISDYFLRDSGCCYELGCSTGSLIRMLAERHADKSDLQFVGLDVEQEMIEEASKKTQKNLEFLLADVLEFSFKRAQFVVLYYTLHFLPKAKRIALLEKLFRSLDDGGGLVIFDKVLADTARGQDIQSKLYEDFKLAQGYSLEQIHQKARSLSSVLCPLSCEENISMFRQVGFSEISTVSKFLGFQGFLLIK